MDSWDLGDTERLILLDALVSYADGCTLPSLTPSCPYYRSDASGPTCEMQCRDLADRLGGRHTAVQEFQVGGLVMQGLALPRSAAGPTHDYDARRLFLGERRLPPRQQSTGALLLGLEVALRRPAFGAPLPADAALSLWGELAHRGLDVDSVVRGSLLAVMATAVGFHAAWPDFVEVAAKAASGPAVPPDDAQAGEWRDVLLAVERNMSSEALRNLRPYRGLRAAAADTAEVAPWRMGDAEAPGFQLMVERQTFKVALSEYFLSRVEEWLSRLLGEDMQAFLASSAAPASVLMALQPAPTARRDEIGLWVYERFTTTSLEEWADSSLMLEWRSSQGEVFECCPDRLLRERDVDPEHLANLTLARVSQRRGRRLRPRGLDANDFVLKAVELLRAGKPAEAADIFAGIVALRPGDGEALNNYGFCLLPVDPQAALVALQGAALYDRREPLINVANTALALHLVGRDEEALALAAQGATELGDADAGAFLWSHDCTTGELLLTEDEAPHTYCRGLIKHLRG